MVWEWGGKIPHLSMTDHAKKTRHSPSSEKEFFERLHQGQDCTSRSEFNVVALISVTGSKAQMFSSEDPYWLNSSVKMLRKAAIAVQSQAGFNLNISTEKPLSLPCAYLLWLLSEALHSLASSSLQSHKSSVCFHICGWHWVLNVFWNSFLVPHSPSLCAALLLHMPFNSSISFAVYQI